MINNHQLDTDANVLLEVLHLGSDETIPRWKEEDYSEILGHQLSASVASELGRFFANRNTPRSLIKHTQLRGQSFRDVLTQLNPSLQSLELIKEYAKAYMALATTLLPKPIFTMLYYASIAAALLRHNQNISSLDSHTVRCGFTWSLSQPWIDPALKPLFEEGLANYNRGQAGNQNNEGLK